MEPEAGSRSPEKARCPFKRPRISGPAFLPGAPAVIDAGRREEAPGANKSPALGRAAPGRESLLAPGTRNKWPPRPPWGSRGCAGAPGGSGGAREPRPPARLSVHRRGIGAGGWGPGGGGAASLWAAPGRGLSAALRPPAPNADFKGSGRPPAPPGAVGGARRGRSAPSHRSAGAAPVRRSTPERGVCAAKGPVGRAFLWRSAQAVRPTYGVSRETAGMTAAGWARTMANSTAVRVSGPPVLITPQSRPPPFPSPSRLGRKSLARCRGASPFGTLSGPSPSLLALSTSAPRGCFPTAGVSLSNFPGCLWDGSSCISVCF